MTSDYKTFHHNNLVVDLHCDTIHKMKRGYDISIENKSHHVDIPRMKKGGVNLQAFALFVDTMPNGQSFNYVNSLLLLLKNQINKNSDQIEICKTSSEASAIINNKKIAALLAIENGMAIENSIENLEYFYAEGIRYMTLTHIESHEWCSSSSDGSAEKFGLTAFGKDVIRKMNELQMMVDVSHISQKAFYDVIDTTTQPVIASHSNVHALCPHDRNLTDEQLRLIAQNNGLVGINFFPVFLSEEYMFAANRYIKTNYETFIEAMQLSMQPLTEKEYNQQGAKFLPFTEGYFEAVKDHPVTYNSVVDHIEYIVDLIGVDHVALGSDFDGILVAPNGLEDISKFGIITKELLDRKYSEVDVKKILGLNFMRVFKAVCG